MTVVHCLLSPTCLTYTTEVSWKIDSNALMESDWDYYWWAFHHCWLARLFICHSQAYTCGLSQFSGYPTWVSPYFFSKRHFWKQSKYHWFYLRYPFWHIHILSKLYRLSYSTAKASVTGASYKLCEWLEWVSEWLIDWLNTRFFHGLAQQRGLRHKQNLHKGSLGGGDDARTLNTCIACA